MAAVEIYGQIQTIRLQDGRDSKHEGKMQKKLHSFKKFNDVV